MPPPGAITSSWKLFLVRLTISLTHPFKLTFSPLSTCTPQMPRLSSSCLSRSVPSNHPAYPKLSSSLLLHGVSPGCSQHTVISPLLDFHKYFWYNYHADAFFFRLLSVLTLWYLLIDYFFQSQYFEHPQWVGVYGSNKRQGRYKQRNGQCCLQRDAFSVSWLLSKIYRNSRFGIDLWPRSATVALGPLAHGITVLAFQETILVRKRLGLVHFF